MKLVFTREMKNDWAPFLQCKLIYKDIMKE